MKAPVVLFLLLFAFLWMVCPGDSSAVTLYVDDDATCPGDGSQTTPYCRIGQAIDASTDGDTIEVEPGIYLEQISIFLKNSIYIRGAGAGHDPSRHSIIDGNGSGPVVHVNINNNPPTLEGFLVTNGNTTGLGGGMLVGLGRANAINCMFEGNSAAMGGGLAIDNGGAVTLDHCTFSGNTAASGAGLYRRATWEFLTMSDCVITDNTGDGAHSAGGQMLVERCSFAGNSGCGLFVENEDARLTVTESLFKGNGSDGLKTGYVTRVSVSNTSFSGNGGAGMHNVADYGGINPQVNVTNSVFLQNGQAGFNTADGWGINLQVSNCLFWQNTVYVLAAAIFDTGGNSIAAVNCIMGGGGAQIRDNRNVTYSNVEVVSGTYPGTGNINADPLFVDADGPDDILGTDDDDFHLQAGSACIDAGTSQNTPAADMQGYDRFDDPLTDDTGAGTYTYYDMGPLEYRDMDGDSVQDYTDNCPDTANQDQADGDGDQIGDLCDPSEVGLSDAIIIMRVLCGLHPEVNPHRITDRNDDGVIGLGEAIFAMQNEANIR